MTLRSRTLTLLVLAPLACGAPKADTAQPEPVAAPAPAPVLKPAAKPIPDGFFVLTPQIIVKGVDEAVDFYVRAFGAQKLLTLPGPDGKTTMHAEIKIGDSIVMLDEEAAEYGYKSPTTLGGTPATLMLYTANADQTASAALAAGAKLEMPLADMFWGDRYGTVLDPFGHRWAVATHLEDLSAEQTRERAALAFPAPTKGKKQPKPPKPGSEPWRKIAGTPARQPVPDGYHTITIAIVSPKAAEAIDFYKAALGATELDRMLMPDGRVLHAELAVGDSKLMLSDSFPEQGSKTALELGGSPLGFMYYTPEVDAAFARFTGAGARPIAPVMDMFWGDRYGIVADPSGFQWGVATHTEDVDPAEMPARMKQQLEREQAAQPST